MKRMIFLISAVLCCFSTALTFAANTEKKVATKPSEKETTKPYDPPRKDKLKQKKPLLDKTKPKASGDPHVEDDPIGTKSGKRTN